MKTKIWIAAAVVCLIAGLALLISGKMVGVLLFLAAFGIGVFGVMKARDAAGYTNDDAFFNGIGGTGRQQSEAAKKEKERI